MIGLPRARIYGQSTQPMPLPPPVVVPPVAPPPVVTPPVAPPPVVTPPVLTTGWLPCSDTSVRHLPAGWAVPAVGPFTFPAPWNTQACRITDDVQGSLLEPIGMSYWRSVNAHRNALDVHVLLSVNQELVVFSVNKETLQPRVWQRLSIPNTGEQVYWSAHDPNVFYLPWRNTLQRVNVVTNAWTQVFAVDEGTYLWQCHSSDDERTHSATVRDSSTEQMLGWVVCREGDKPTFIPTVGDPDECAIDGSGDWLVAKEKFPKPIGESNRIFYKADARSARNLSDPDGAAGHSDMGAGYVVGENDFAPQPNALDKIDLATLAARRVYHGITWASGVGYVSLTNVHDRRFGVVTNATTQDNPRDNEIVLITLDGSLLFKPLAPSLADLNRADVYSNRPKANVCPYGEFVCWTANHGERHLDAFLARVPR